MPPDVIAEEFQEEFLEETDETAEAIALAVRLHGILRRPVELKPADGHGQSDRLEDRAIR